MNEFWMKDILWGIAAWRAGIAIAIIFFSFLSRKIIHSLFQGVIARKTRETAIKWDDELAALIPPPLAVFIQVLLWYGAAYVLVLPRLPVDTRHYIFKGLEAALGIAATWAGLRLIDVLSNALERLSGRTESRLDDQLIPLIRKTLKFILVTAASVMIIQNMGYSVTSMVASLGVGGLALALAAKDTIANVFGSVIVFTDRPFHVGDWVEFSGMEGTIEEIGFRTTRVRRFDKSQITVPNSMFSTIPIINHSRRPVRRLYLTVGVSYDTGPDQMQTLLNELRKMLSGHPALDQSFHYVHFVGFGESSLNVEIYCFTKSTDWLTFLSAQEDILLNIMEIIETNGLEIAFPTRTVHLRDVQRIIPPMMSSAGKNGV